MFLSTNLYRAVTEPPAHLLHLTDAACAVRQHDVGEDDVIMVAAVQHHETRNQWHQAFVLTQPAARRLIAELIAHTYQHGPSHGPLREADDDDDPPM